MRQVTTIIFDMYDTLVDNDSQRWNVTFADIARDQALGVSGQVLGDAWHAVEEGFKTRRVIPGAPFESYFEGWKDCFANAFTRLGVTGDADSAANKAIRDLCDRKPFPETHDALDILQENWRTAVLSNADDRYLIPNIQLLGRSFEAILSSESARCYKPLPQLFQTMLRRLSVAPAETVYVGDKQFEDVQGASNVGMHTVWINRTNAPPNPALPPPEFQIRSLLELPGILSGTPGN